MVDHELCKEVLARFVGHDYVPGGPVVLAWHVHHGRLCERLRYPIQDRIDCILTIKSETESDDQIRLRLRLLAPVRGPWPSVVVEAAAALDRARAAYGRVWAAYAAAALDRAEAALDQALQSP